MFSKELDRYLSIRDVGLSGHKVVVVGDLMLDRYLWGSVRRISPEVPVPVVRLVRQTEMAGGAGNVVRNLAGLGLGVTVGGCIGDDVEGDHLLKRSTWWGLTPLRWSALPTGRRSPSRGSWASTSRCSGSTWRAWMCSPRRPTKAFSRRSRGRSSCAASAVVLSDYDKGVLSPQVCRMIIDAARRHGIPVLVDPKGRDFTKYRGATTITPNRAELSGACGLPGDDLEGLSWAGRELMEQLGLDFLTLTLGDQGIRLIDAGGVHQIPTMAKEVFDVSGAGDTVIATLAAGLVAGLRVLDAVVLANLAAGIVVGKLGTATIDREELARELRARELCGGAGGSKFFRREEQHRYVEDWRKQGSRIVFTNGCFDILHSGHVTYLEAARSLGDRLIVGLNSDDSVRRLKGNSRPVNCLEDRARVLGALACVDAVVGFDEDTPLELINALRPDVLVKGGDYDEARIVGALEVRSWGGEVRTIPLLEGRSTTRLLEIIQERDERRPSDTPRTGRS